MDRVQQARFKMGRNPKECSFFMELHTQPANTASSRKTISRNWKFRKGPTLVIFMPQKPVKVVMVSSSIVPRKMEYSMPRALRTMAAVRSLLLGGFAR